jgi:hypothetical protein
MQADFRPLAPTAFVVRKMAPRDIDEVAELLADVFADNPAYCQIFRPKDTIRGLCWLFKRNLLLNQRYGVVRVICLPGADGQIIGTFSLVPPGSDAPSVVDYLKLGLLNMPFKFGLPALIRMFALMNQNQGKISAAAKGAPCWYLGLVAVSRMHRNNGIASGALTRAFGELEASSRVVLSTQLESNVRFYARLGFQLLAENHMGYRHNMVRNWVMCRINEWHAAP